jgi:hypothetical protein
MMILIHRLKKNVDKRINKVFIKEVVILTKLYLPISPSPSNIKEVNPVFIENGNENRVINKPYNNKLLNLKIKGNIISPSTIKIIPAIELNKIPIDHN